MMMMMMMMKYQIDIIIWSARLVYYYTQYYIHSLELVVY